MYSAFLEAISTNLMTGEDFSPSRFGNKKRRRRIGKKMGI